MSVLTSEHLAYIGRQAPPDHQVVTRRDIRKYAIASGQTAPHYLAGDVAPPLFHVALFWPIVTRDAIAPDGVAIDPFMPSLPLTRAMAGGLEIEYHEQIRAGDELIAVRTLTNLSEKSGRSGPLIFYNVLMEVRRPDGALVITEKTTRILR